MAYYGWPHLPGDFGWGDDENSQQSNLSIAKYIGECLHAGEFEIVSIEGDIITIEVEFVGEDDSEFVEFELQFSNHNTLIKKFGHDYASYPIPQSVLDELKTD